MATISVKDNLKALKPGISRMFRDQIPFATSQALNDVARRSATEDSRRDMEQQLDRPIPWTKSGQRYRRGNKRNLTSWVYIAPERAEYMRLQIAGGRRLPVPGTRGFLIAVKAKRNKYGNPPKGSPAKLASRADTFWGTINGTYGLWQRTGPRNLALLFYVSPRADYTQGFDWPGSVALTVRQSFNYHFTKRFNAAVKTAR